AIRLYDFPMNDEAALKLLLREEVKIADADTYALELIKELENLPLALDLAGASMRMDELTPETYLKMVKEIPGICLRSNKSDFEDYMGLTSSPYENTVLTVWIDTLARLEKRDFSAASLLRYMALLYPDYIPITLFDGQTPQILDLGKTKSWSPRSA